MIVIAPPHGLTYGHDRCPSIKYDTTMRSPQRYFPCRSSVAGSDRPDATYPTYIQVAGTSTPRTMITEDPRKPHRAATNVMAGVSPHIVRDARERVANRDRERKQRELLERIADRTRDLMLQCSNAQECRVNGDQEQLHPQRECHGTSRESLPGSPGSGGLEFSRQNSITPPQQTVLRLCSDDARRSRPVGG
jgi:hypothetical protein